MSRTHEVVIYTDEKLNPDPNVRTEIGYVEELATQKKILSIVYCRNNYLWTGQHTLIMNNGQYCDYEVHLDDLYYGLLEQNESVFEAMMMHETGHLVNGDFESLISMEVAMKNREKLVRQNRVAEEELLADRFAVEQCGKETVLAMLDHLIATRIKRGYGLNDVGIIEAGLRKRAVNRL